MTKKEAKKKVPQEPDRADVVEAETPEEENIWMRGLFMVILAILFKVGTAILGLAALIQFIWMVAKKEKNQPIADFGEGMADWLARIIRFLVGASDDKPFPFAKWGKDEG